MNLSHSLFVRSLLPLGLSASVLAIAFAAPRPSTAQEIKTETAEETVWGEPSSDPFAAEAGASGLLDLMQQLNRGPSQSWAEFRASQQENLSNEALEFRNRQLQLIKGNPTPLNDAVEDIETDETDLQSANPVSPSPYPALW